MLSCPASVAPSPPHPSYSSDTMNHIEVLKNLLLTSSPHLTLLPTARSGQMCSFLRESVLFSEKASACWTSSKFLMFKVLHITLPTSPSRGSYSNLHSKQTHLLGLPNMLHIGSVLSRSSASPCLECSFPIHLFAT